MEDTQTSHVKLLVAKHVTLCWAVLQGLQHVPTDQGSEMEAFWQAPTTAHS
jgi:hypothetical protein